MGFSCDLCGKGVSIDHKVACERCYNLFLHMLAAFEGAKKEKRTYKKRKVKRKTKKMAVLSKSIKEIKAEKKEEKPKKTEREIMFEKASLKKADPVDLLTKCATCEFSFLDGQTKKISCTDGKDPKSCGK